MNKSLQIMRIALTVFSINFIFLSCIAQEITKNDGFEGTSQRAVPPPHWNNSESGPSSVDTQPNIFDNIQEASQGETYISLITRRVGPPGSKETVWADLINPLEQGKCYSFDIDLSLSNQFNATYNWTQVYYFNEKPCVFQIIGFNGEIHNTEDLEILWESENLFDAFWQTFNAEISPVNNTYERIALRPNFAMADEYKNTVVLVDNLRHSIYTNIFTYENGILNIPDGATEISWYYNGQFIPNETANQMPILGSGLYEARFFDGNNCFVITSEEIDIDYDHLACYPVPTADQTTVECFSSQEGTFKLYLYNELGQLVLIEDKDVVGGINKITLNLNQLPDAVYYLQIHRMELNSLMCTLLVVKH